VKLDKQNKEIINAIYNVLEETSRLLKQPKLVHWKKVYQQLISIFKSLNRMIKAEITRTGYVEQFYAKDRLVEEEYEVYYDTLD
jgi:hypothetical protein